MPEPPLDIAKLAPDDPVGFASMLAIYQQAIEPSEQKPAAEIAAIVANPRYCVLVLRVNGEVRGFAISYFPDDDFWLLEYVAVDATVRSHGFGRALFFAARNAAEERAANAPCVLEVDAPKPDMAPTNNVARRFRFYAALGCRRIEGLDYILPLTANGPPPPMTLLVHGLDGSDTLPKAQLARWLRTIYPEVYAQPADDSRIVTMLSPLPSQVPLALL